VGNAVLSIWDTSRSSGEVVDLEVSWDRGYDIDSSVKVPARFRKAWEFASAMIKRERRGQLVKPYSTLSTGVSTKDLNRTATGIYAVAKEIWGRQADWRVSPPYPKSSESPPEGAVQ